MTGSYQHTWSFFLLLTSQKLWAQQRLLDSDYSLLPVLHIYLLTCNHFQTAQTFFHYSCCQLQQEYLTVAQFSSEMYCTDWYFSWAKLCLTTGKRQQLLFWNKLLCETWHLHLFSKTASHVTFWARSSKKAGFVSYHLWSISLSYLLYCQPFLHCQSIMCSSIERNVKPVFWGVRFFSWCVHTLPKLQLQASTQPVTCFPECFRVHHSRLTPQNTIQSSAS